MHQAGWCITCNYNVINIDQQIDDHYIFNRSSNLSRKNQSSSQGDHDTFRTLVFLKVVITIFSKEFLFSLL